MSNHIVLFGKYLEPDQGDVVGRLSLRFQSGTLDIDELWESSSLSAEFLSTFWGKFFPINKEAEVTSDIGKDEVHYICGELLGNAIKFSFSPNYMIEICLYLHQSELRFYVTNSVNPAELEEFQSFIRKLLTENTQQLFVEQMEKNASEDSNESGVGYLTLINDYNVSVAWKFEGIEAGIQSVTALARMPIVRKVLA
ncbi:slr1658 superfamily regulator [Desulfonema magnum]|uniref:ATP-binding protein n=1 Tax=Desulfonema magnum TaxID=45655 RepID=A0A975BKG8_9BACT|nr:hypothetical protein [Desulfonema magnum]QTA87217.1 Uncharacterized protein dnm_032470 [Desulfonema magnum]